MINAETHSDDRVFEVEFDAEPWFKQASDEEILALAACEWGGDYPADSVALFFEGEGFVADMFSYLSRANQRRRDPLGFECHVDEADAIAWLREHRPALSLEQCAH